MTSRETLPQAYARFLKLVSQAGTLSDLVSLNPAEERVLQCLAVAWSEGQKVTVLEAMGLQHGLSQSTAHRRLTSLRKKGLLMLKQHDQDARVRYVLHTDRTERHFAHMGRCILEAAKDVS